MEFCAVIWIALHFQIKIRSGLSKNWGCVGGSWLKGTGGVAVVTEAGPIDVDEGVANVFWRIDLSCC